MNDKAHDKQAAEREMIDANALERMAKERPDESFLKGRGVLKLIGAIRDLEAQVRALKASEAMVREKALEEAAKPCLRQFNAYCQCSRKSTLCNGVGPVSQG